MSHFTDYCDEIEKARKQGFGRIVLPAAISLPDICGRVEYSGKIHKGTHQECNDDCTDKYYWISEDGHKSMQMANVTDTG